MIFLFRLDVVDNGINFVLNEGIVMDMIPIYEPLIKEISFLMCTLLSIYKSKSKTSTLFTATVLDDNTLDLKFSEGLGKYIDEKIKNTIYEDAKMIANICAEIMNQGCINAKKGN
jgi:hypothetical protein